MLSEALKDKNPQVRAQVGQYLKEHQRLSFSAITVYEIIRGFRATHAQRQLAGFTKLVNASDVLPVSQAVLDRAASLWAAAYGGGHPRDDADLIIAATALEAQRVLVTGNTAHFQWIAGLELEDWRKP
jgi:predicted nucleic acid-binding protein